MNGSFHEYVMQDVLSEVDGLTSRRMFGGYGVYQRDVFFGLIAENRLYFKVLPESQKLYKERGSRPFQYSAKDRKLVTLSYWEVPVEILEDSHAVHDWVLRAVEDQRKSKKEKVRASTLSGTRVLNTKGKKKI
jgi:DNA transformation protein and related proteins